MIYEKLFKDNMFKMPDLYLEIAGKKFFLEIETRMGSPSYAGDWIHCDATTYYIAVREDERKTSPRWFYTYFTINEQIMEAMEHRYDIIEKQMMMRIEQALTHKLKVTSAEDEHLRKRGYIK